MEYLIVGALVGLIVWTAAVAGASWYVRGQVAQADVKLLDYALEAKEIEVDHLTEIMEAMEQGQKIAVAHLRRRIEAARAADPRARRRGLYVDRGGGADAGSPAPVDEAQGPDAEVAEA